MSAFSDKAYWCVILGGSSGMGLATAKKMASEGMNICIVHRDRRSELEHFRVEVEGIRNSGVECLTFNRSALSQDEMHNVLKELKSAMKAGDSVKMLLHSVAKGNLKAMTDLDEETEEPKLTEEDFMLTLHGMAVSYYTWIKAIYEAKMFASDAVCIGLTSEGNMKAWRYYAAVSSAKVSLESISRSVALEFAKKGIRSNIIQAGITETPSFKIIPGSEKLKEDAEQRNPMGRLTTTEDVANAIYLLCLPEAHWINGAIIPVDGGERIS